MEPVRIFSLPINSPAVKSDRGPLAIPMTTLLKHGSQIYASTHVAEPDIAIVAVPAPRIHTRSNNGVARFDLCHAFSNFFHVAGHFMTGYAGQLAGEFSLYSMSIISVIGRSVYSTGPKAESALPVCN